VVEKGTKGLEYGRKISKIGNRATQTGELFFNDCKANYRSASELRKSYTVASKISPHWSKTPAT
jgi:alkylation response protein AidB-like acyl-CoA dehydrogenase